VTAVNGLPVVGTPLAYGLGFLLLVLIAFAWVWVRPLVHVADRGGYHAVAVLTFRGPRGFRLDDNGRISTEVEQTGWGVGNVLSILASMFTPPLLGLAGAALIARGNAFAVLWSAAFLLVAAFLVAKDGLAYAITLLALAGVAWAIVTGSPTVQAGVAVALVWWMLLGGLRASVGRYPDEDNRFESLVRYTWIPKFIWQGLWIFVAVIALLRGGRLLLFP
jgi:hypothetical protein